MTWTAPAASWSLSKDRFKLRDFNAISQPHGPGGRNRSISESPQGCAMPFWGAAHLNCAKGTLMTKGGQRPCGSGNALRRHEARLDRVSGQVRGA
jgi:hypothetical protein